MFTGSPLTAPPLESLTVAVIVAVLTPSAGMLVLELVTVTVAAWDVLCVIVTVTALPVPASVAVTPQKPGVVEEV
jgi:hypothetical protein